MGVMSKWTTKTQLREPALATAQPEPALPPGRWMQVRRVRENGVSGWALDELVRNADGSYGVKRIHGPDLFDIVNFRHEQEVAA